MKRVVKFNGPKAAAAYELAYASLANFQPGPKEDVAAEAYSKLSSIGRPKPREANQNPDLELMTIQGPAQVELLESERDIVLEAIARVPWPTFVLATKRCAVEILRDAQAVEIEAA